ncbi:hypothetical protein ACFWY6_44155, partial [Streptomyces sp. NPDC059037]|uniref:hypothetical protein n=1 Tax=Streptomyces sp. NPDC059037 TaxID=3346710 RepID=UPI00367E7E62
WRQPMQSVKQNGMASERALTDYPVTQDAVGKVHDDEHRVLELEDAEGPAEPISICLQGYGLAPEPGNVFIKDWSEHSGLTARLAQAGLVKPVRALTVGPFGSTAYAVQVTL